ncbi:MAG: hypothetical protein GTO14_17805 [Anaerolineales bacterium]|nr:hypothetical protein [Anaerolineales bacterium]
MPLDRAAIMASSCADEGVPDGRGVGGLSGLGVGVGVDAGGLGGSGVLLGVGRGGEVEPV